MTERWGQKDAEGTAEYVKYAEQEETKNRTVSFRDRLALSASQATQSAAAQLCGQHYCIRAEVARNIYLPKDLAALSFLSIRIRSGGRMLVRCDDGANDCI
jgi:hypothetical protein